MTPGAVSIFSECLLYIPVAVTAEHCRDGRDCASDNCASGTMAHCVHHVCTCDAGDMTTPAMSKFAEIGHVHRCQMGLKSSYHCSLILKDWNHYFKVSSSDEKIIIA